MSGPGGPRLEAVEAPPIPHPCCGQLVVLQRTGVLAWVGDSAALHVDMDAKPEQAHQLYTRIWLACCRLTPAEVDRILRPA